MRRDRNGWRRVATWMQSHRAVALLWGAPNKSGLAFSEALVVDHLAEGNHSNYKLENLQFLTTSQNVSKYQKHSAQSPPC